jgi:tetratricopeptide (TPR) repeat protein
MAKTAQDEVQRESLAQMQRKIQSNDYEAARALVHQFQTYFPGNPELSRVQAALKNEETRQTDARNALLQRAEAAMIRGNYVTPAGENVLVYCGKLLALDRDNVRALTLRKESLQKAAGQAKELIQKERFDEAREVLTALYGLSGNDGKSTEAQEAKILIGRIEFTTIPVVHDHTLGSCSGQLRMNAFVIAYLPSGESKDGFSQKITNLIGVEGGEKLKIQLKNKTYRFQVNSPSGKDDSRQRMKGFFDQLNRIMQQANRTGGFNLTTQQTS